MEIFVTRLDFYNSRYWFWYFKKFTYIKGFTIRLFGIHVMIKEKNSLEKLIKIWHENRNLKKLT